MKHTLRQHAPINPRTLVHISAMALLLCPPAAWSDDLDIVEQNHPTHVEHITQEELNTRFAVAPLDAFLFAFDLGDELFEVDFTAVDGGGANVGNGERTTRLPRADLNAPGQWASHFPARATGPNASSCASCHSLPVADGAGSTAADVHRDPFHTGDIAQMIHRNTPHLHGMGAIQRLAEEMTEALHAQRDEAIALAKGQRRAGPIIVALEAKGVSFGEIVVQATTGNRRKRAQKSRGKQHGTMSRPMGNRGHGSPDRSDVEIDFRNLEGIDEDLVVKPFQWKGTFPTVRSFNLDAMHNELGVQPREILADGLDGDGDGVHTETTIGDMTALTLYMAAQPRPTTRVELGENARGPVVTDDEIARINVGEAVFNAIGCAVCHVPELTIDLPVFSEPSTNVHYRDATLPGGQDPVALGLDPDRPLTFDLTADQPDNKVYDTAGNFLRHIGALESNGAGGAIVRAYGDMKRHDMGYELAESIDEAGTGASVFMTENLWGVGVTAPYLHDGRASTLTEAILWHHGDARDSRQAFQRSGPDEQAALIAFLENMVIFLPE